MNQQLDTLYALCTTISASIIQLRQKMESCADLSDDIKVQLWDSYLKISSDFAAFRSLSANHPADAKYEKLQQMMEEVYQDFLSLKELFGDFPQMDDPALDSSAEDEEENSEIPENSDKDDESAEEFPIDDAAAKPPQKKKKATQAHERHSGTDDSKPEYSGTRLSDEEKKQIAARIGITFVTAVLMTDEELLNADRQYREYRAQMENNSETFCNTSSVPLEKIIRPAEQFSPNQGPDAVDPTAITLPKNPLTAYRRKVFTLSNIGGLSYQTISSAIHKAESKIDHDTVRTITTGHYYLSTAYGFAKAILPQNPAARMEIESLQTPTRTTSSTQALLERKKKLTAQLNADSVTTGYVKGTEQNKRLQQLTAIRLELESIDKQLQGNQRIHLANHQQQLQKSMLQSLMPNGKVPRSPQKVNELSQTYLRKQHKRFEKKYGDLLENTPKQLTTEKQRLLALAKQNKQQIMLLKAKRRLGLEERNKLAALIVENRKIGKAVGSLTGANRSIADMNYCQQQLHSVMRAAGKRKNRIISAAFLARNLMIRPLYSGDNNTEGLAYVINYGTNPTTYRLARKAGKIPIKLTGKVLNRVAPELSNHAHLAAKKVKKEVRRSVYTTKQRIISKIPQPVRDTSKTAAQYVQKGKGKYTKLKMSIRCRKFAVKSWFAKTPVGQWFAKASKAGSAVTRATGAVSAFGIKVLAVAVLSWMVVGVITVASTTIISGLGSSLILSPETSDSGKINLSPHTSLIRMEMSRFNSALADIMQKYENDEAYDNVEMTYSGVANNMREMLSMMAVRMKQDLDVNTNPKVKEYISYLYKASHTYSVQERKYTCTGCKERVVQKITIDPETLRPTLSQLKEIYCPGHIDVSILVKTLSFDEIFAVDQYDDGEYWEGWNDNNITWCKTIYEMDWLQLYDGLNIAGDISIGGVQSSAHEQYIWNFLLEMVGNEYGAAGLMGNLYAESGLDPTNMENQYETIIGHNDASYTASVDNGTYTNFVNDKVGYGLAQWTFHTRKAGLLQLAQGRGTSIGNLDTQLAFLKSELAGGSILRDLSNASSIREASDIVMIRFENPKDQSETAKSGRASLCQYFYNKMTLGVNSEGDLTEAQIRVIQIATNSASYGIDATGGYCQRWAAMVYAAAGFPIDNSCCAFHSGQRYGVSDDWSKTPPGAAVYGYSGSQYGHVGIYVGNGLVYHNVGGVAIDTLEDWVNKYRGFAWGWEAGTDLTQAN